MDIAADGLRPVFKAIDDLRSRVGNIWVFPRRGCHRRQRRLARAWRPLYHVQRVTSIASHEARRVRLSTDIAELVPRLDMNTNNGPGL